MNQILVVGSKKGKSNNSAVDIKKIVLFFSIAIIVFGAILAISGVVGLNKGKKKNNDNAINSPGSNPVETPNETTAPVEPVVEDNELPTIDLSIAGENIKIIARDATQIDYIEYQWNEEEAQRVNASEEDKNKIETSVEIKQGTNILKVKAVDKAGNEQEESRSFKGTIRPTVNLAKNDSTNELIMEVECADGISKIEFTLNGERTLIPFEGNTSTKEEWASLNVIVDYSDDGKIIKAKYTVPMVDGENILNVYAYSLEGLVGYGDGKATKQ